MLTLISSCKSGADLPAPPKVIDTACDWVQPIYVTDNDLAHMSPETKRAILTHDEKWQAKCGTQQQRAAK